MTKVVQVDHGYAWLVVAASFMIHLLTVGFSWSAGVYNTIFLHVFNDSKTVTAWAGSLNTASMYAGGPFASMLTNKFGCRPTIMAGGILSASSLMISYFVPNIYCLYFTFGIMTGVGFGIAYIPAITAVAQFFEKYRGIATGIAVTGVGVGTFIFPPVINMLNHMFGWRGSLLLNGAIVLNVTVCGALIRPIEGMEHRQEKRPIFDITVFRKAAYNLIAINNVLVCVGLSVVYLHLVAFAEDCGRSENESSMLVSSIGIANLIGRFALAATSNHPCVNVIVYYSVCFILSGVVACLFPVISFSYICLVIVSSLFGFFTGCFGALLPSVLVEVLGIHKFANGYGFLLMFMALGQAIGGPLAGFLFDVTKSYNTSLYVGGSVIILGGVFPLFRTCTKSLRRTVEIDEEEPGEKVPLPSST